MRHLIKSIIFALVCIGIILFSTFGIKRCRTPEKPDLILRDTVVIYKIDTIHHTNVVYKDRWKVRTDTIELINKGDTIHVPIPIDKYVFTDDSTYIAEVSGFKVTMDKMDVYRRNTERIVTVIQKEKIKKFGVGIQLGYGYGTKGFQPYIGIGISYNPIRF